jgi:hypothetical protein
MAAMGVQLNMQAHRVDSFLRRAADTAPYLRRVVRAADL